MCVCDRIEDLSQLFLDTKKPMRRQKENIQEVTSALYSLPVKWTKENMLKGSTSDPKGVALLNKVKIDVYYCAVL